MWFLTSEADGVLQLKILRAEYRIANKTTSNELVTVVDEGELNDEEYTKIISSLPQGSRLFSTDAVSKGKVGDFFKYSL